MLPLVHARRWRLASVALLFCVLLATVLPAVWFWSDRIRLAQWIDGIDKWAHALTFAGLAIWFSGQYRSDAYLRIAVGLLAFGTLIEICQRMLSYRSAEWFDLAADAVGIVAGLAIARAGVGGWSLRFESWLMKQRA